MSSALPKAIFRVEKLKTIADIGGSLSHNYRNRHTPNADTAKEHLNEHSLLTNTDCMAAIKNRIPEKHRKDAVLCIEHLITASNQWHGWGTEKEAEFFEKSREWLETKYGAENVISWTIHRDETTPHMVVYVVPVDHETGRLNCKKWLGGTRHTLSKLQTEFHEQVKHLGLERGLEGSQAKHKKIKDHYEELKKPLEKVHLQKSNTPQISYKDSELHALDAARLKNKKIKDYVQGFLDSQYLDYQEQFLKIQEGFETKLKEQKLRAEKEAESHQIAVARIKNLEEKIINLKNEFSQIIEYKSLFPEKFKSVEYDLKRDINTHKARKEQEEYERNYWKKKDLENQQEQKSLIKQKARNDFIEKVQSESTQGLDQVLKVFNTKISNTTDPLVIAALKATQIEIESFKKLVSDPQKIFESGKDNEPTTNPYFSILNHLAYVKNNIDFDQFLDFSLKIMKNSKYKAYDDKAHNFNNSFLDEVNSTIPYIIAIEKVLAKQLIKYGQEYYNRASELKTYLAESLKVKGQKSFESALDLEQRKQKIAENNHRKELMNNIKSFNNNEVEQPKVKNNRDFEM